MYERCEPPPAWARRRGRPAPRNPTASAFIGPGITQRRHGGKTKRMGAAASRKRNSKMTLLSIYKERLGGFTSGGGPALAGGGAINGRFRFLFFFCGRRWAVRADGKSGRGRLRRGPGGKREESLSEAGAEETVSRSGRRRGKRERE